MCCWILKKFVCIVLPLHGVKVGCMEVMLMWSVDVSAFCEGIEGVGGKHVCVVFSKTVPLYWPGFFL